MTPNDTIIMLVSAVGAMALFIVGLLRWAAKTLKEIREADIDREDKAFVVVVNCTKAIEGFGAFIRERIK